MKTKNFESSFESFAVFAITSEEMMTIRGGNDGEPVNNPVTPPIKV